MRIYLSGIGGAGLMPLALFARDAGYDTIGSDQEESPNTQALTGAGLAVYIGQSGQEIAAAHQEAPIDWLICSSAIPYDHPEVQFARSNNIRIGKRADLINHILQEKNLSMIACAGTHGKTTCTTMLVWLFKSLGVPISYSIGTNISFGPAGKYQPESQFFIYEADEYDKNFLAFQPYASIISALDYDHADTYPTINDYLLAFSQFIDQSKMAITWEDVAQYAGLDHANLTVLDDKTTDLSGITLHGIHNRKNAYLCMQLLRHLRPSSGTEQLISIINKFPGSGRRMERLADNLYTDYAHHPVEIAAILQQASELSRNVVVVYQPHQNSRQHELKDQYRYAFNIVKKIYWLPTYLSREDEKLPVLKPQELISYLTNPAIAEIADMDESLLAKIKDHRRSGDLVIVMGAGSIDPWLRQHLPSQATAPEPAQ